MRPQDIKNLGYGLAIGILIAGVFWGGILSFVHPQLDLQHAQALGFLPGPITPQTFITPTALSTNTFTPTPTLSPGSTPMPSPTPTEATTDLMIASGDIFITGPLTREQQIRLYDASQAYIALTEKASKQVSSMINLLPFSDPNTVCGPLSIAILQRADILGADLVPHDFFLINPDLATDRLVLQKAFPKNLYSDTHYKVRLNQFDWSQNPLLPGDFVYIYAGEQGNFEHMLVVNRVDYLGRAYSVTNYNTENGFIINEVMLYDPKDPTTGIFAQWTKREKQKLGSTGFAGFEVWRLKDTQ